MALKINSQSLEDTQVEYISQKYTKEGMYTFEKYTFGKYIFEKYTFEKYALRFLLFTFHLSLFTHGPTQLPTYRRTWVGV